MAKGHKTGGGSRKGIPNKITGELRQMVLEALSRVGGIDYLARQAEKENAAPFMALLGKIIPQQIGGDPDNPIVQKLETIIVDPKGGKG